MNPSKCVMKLSRVEIQCFLFVVGVVLLVKGLLAISVSCEHIIYTLKGGTENRGS